MTKPEILSEAPMNIFELKQEIDKIKKRDKELNFRAERTDEYLHHVAHISPQKAKELYEKYQVKLIIIGKKERETYKIRERDLEKLGRVVIKSGRSEIVEITD